MSKSDNFSATFCIVIGGLSAALLYRADYVSFILILLLSAGAVIVFNLLPEKNIILGLNTSNSTNFFIVLYSVVSCSVSVTTAASIVTKTSIVAERSYPLLILFTGGLAICFAMSKRKAMFSTCTAVTVISAVVFAILFLLCFIKTSFSAPIPQRTEAFRFIPVCIFSVFDIFLLLPSLQNPNKKIMVIGALCASAYMALLTLTAVSVLSPDIYYSLDMPLIKMWKSTYIASFLNSFEIVIICSFAIICSVKAGIVLWPAYKILGKKYAVLSAFAMYGFCIVLKAVPYAIYFFSFIAVFSCFACIICANASKREKTCQMKKRC